MKIKLLLFLSCVFVLNVAMRCDDDYDEDRERMNILRIEAFNLNNEGQDPVLSDDPIKKEAYVIGIERITDAQKEEYYYIPNDTVESEKIYTLNNLNAQYPAGSDVTSLFVKMPYGSWSKYMYALRKEIEPGVHSFKIVLSCTNGNVFETSTTPINLY